jgi:hypothetical protein
LLDFQDAAGFDVLGGDFKCKTICSNSYEDEKLCFDVINTSNFNRRTMDQLCRHLFGAIEQSKEDYCDDHTFLHLLFGSMGTFDHETIKKGYVGCWTWRLGFYSDTEELMKRLIAEGEVAEDEYPSITWLEHAMRTVAGTLRPIDAYYRPPMIRDAMGYDSDDGYY